VFKESIKLEEVLNQEPPLHFIMFYKRILEMPLNLFAKKKK
jgi:hypothetical protein